MLVFPCFCYLFTTSNPHIIIQSLANVPTRPPFHHSTPPAFLLYLHPFSSFSSSTLHLYPSLFLFSFLTNTTTHDTYMVTPPLLHNHNNRHIPPTHTHTYIHTLAAAYVHHQHSLTSPLSPLRKTQYQGHPLHIIQSITYIPSISINPAMNNSTTNK